MSRGIAVGVLRLFATRSLAERYLERGLVHLDRKQYEEALADLTSAIVEEPYNAELYATRGFIYLESNRPEFLEYARADFDYALQLDPTQWVAHYCRGMIAFAAQEYREALDSFAAAHIHVPLRPEISYYLGLCHAYLEELEDAIRDMAAAVDLFQAQNDSRQRYARSWLRLFKQAQRGRPALPRGRATP